MPSLRLALLAAAALAAPLAQAHVATISGSYDTLAYDTPGLTFHNTSGFDFTNAQITLTPYQPGTLTYGLAPQTRSLGPILAGTDYNFIWSEGMSAGNLFSYDYDDSYGGGGPCPANPVSSGLCNNVGNFMVTFTAMWNGQAIYSQFSPHTNATGGFVGWEGLNPDGLSEDPTYDVHNGSLTGTLAYIDIGTPPPPVPEPSTYALMAAGLGIVGWASRRRKA